MASPIIQISANTGAIRQSAQFSANSMGCIATVAPSVAFRPNRECGSTTWVTYETPSGDIRTTTLEYLLDQPTHYPVDPELNGLTAAYQVWVLSQQDKSAARQYAIQHGENTGDTLRHEAKRMRRLCAIRAAAAVEPVPARRGFGKAA